MTMFRLRYETEPDTNWTMILEGEVEAPTLAKAYESGQDSLGMTLARESHFFDRKKWTVEVGGASGAWMKADECKWCGGSGDPGNDDADNCLLCLGHGWTAPGIED